MRVRSNVSFVVSLWLWSSLCLASSHGNATSDPLPYAIVRQALQQALHLNFQEAFDTARQLKAGDQPTLIAQLTSGIIAYLQVRWQTPAARKRAEHALETVLTMAQKPNGERLKKPQRQLVQGTAAVFLALLRQQHEAWASMQLFARGEKWLREALIANETLTDAHLGLGALYFAGTDLPLLLRRALRSLRTPSPAEAMYHLRRAITTGHFAQDLARTLLAEVYEREKQYRDAITLGQKLTEAFPENGFYALLTGRSQCAYAQYAACAATLATLAARLATSKVRLVRRTDRFDLYYFWGRALYERHDYKRAFQAFRRAINADPRLEKDETLWATYYLAKLYEYQGQIKTARQMYQTLLRRRNVADLHAQVERCLARLQRSR